MVLLKAMPELLNPLRLDGDRMLESLRCGSACKSAAGNDDDNVAKETDKEIRGDGDGGR